MKQTRRAASLASIWVLLAASACSDASRPVSVQGEPLAQQVAKQRYLPYGVPIPESEEVTLPPEPYDPSRHGPLLPNTQPEANLVGKPGWEFLDSLQGRAGGAYATASQTIAAAAKYDSGGFGILSTYEGIRWTPSPLRQWYGIQASHEVLPITYALPNYPNNGEIALSTHPAGYACLEATTVGRLLFGVMSSYNGFTNFCGSSGSGSYYEAVDSIFRSKYVRTIHGRPGVSMSVVTPNIGGSNFNGACWHGSLYNYNVGGWEGKVANKCNTGFNWQPNMEARVYWHTNGFGVACTTVHGLRATDILLYDSNIPVPWNKVPSTSLLSQSAPFAPGGCKSSGTWAFTYPDSSVHATGNAFVARTPNP